MYRKKNRQVQKENVTISLEELVPENHLLRAIDKSIDFNFIYDEWKIYTATKVVTS